MPACKRCFMITNCCLIGNKSNWSKLLYLGPRPRQLLQLSHFERMGEGQDLELKHFRELQTHWKICLAWQLLSAGNIWEINTKSAWLILLCQSDHRKREVHGIHQERGCVGHWHLDMNYRETLILSGKVLNSWNCLALKEPLRPPNSKTLAMGRNTFH